MPPTPRIEVKPTLLTLPPELTFYQITKHLPPASILNLALTCKQLSKLLADPYTWITQIEANYGAENVPHDESVSALETFKELSRTHRYATELGITWLNSTYWELVQMEDSISPQIAKLHNVCWLDVQATFQSVAEGTYIPYFRIQLSQVAYNNRMLDEVQFGIEVFDPPLPKVPEDSDVPPIPIYTAQQSLAHVLGENRGVLENGELGWVYLELGEFS
ncbi:hypothetical protein HDV05_003004, partial [Chytridiales sp. JEL 0842]